MPLPEPEPGLVIRYAYLWKREADKGQVEGSKDRPCALIGRVDREKGEAPLVWVIPLTHTAPATPEDGFEIPLATRKRLGLDEDTCWAILTEYNQFTWPGPDLRPSVNGDFAYGFLPPRLYNQIRQAIVDRVTKRKIARSDRG